jgi:hypothetical protein
MDLLLTAAAATVLVLVLVREVGRVQRAEAARKENADRWLERSAPDVGQADAVFPVTRTEEAYDGHHPATRGE